MKLLEVRDLKAYYATSSGYVRAVDGVSFDLEQDQVMGVVGESGSGKSTLGMVLSNTMRPPLRVMSGEVLFRGEDIFKIGQERLRHVRAKGISIIPQYAMNALNPTSRVRDIIRDLLLSHDVPLDEFNYRMKLARERALRLGLPQWALDRYSIELSGGMRQRVTILISTLLDPDVLIADEPTSALDVVIQRLVIQYLQDLMNESVVKSMVFITHDIALVNEIATDVAVMYAGQFVEVGPAEDVLSNPRHPYTQALVSSIPEPGVRIARKHIVGLKGEPPSLVNPPSGCRFHPRCPFVKDICTREEPRPVSIDGRRRVSCWLYGGE
ncbi:MAG: ABC transporter ATP-binding protein [Acidilobus sp.]